MKFLTALVLIGSFLAALHLSEVAAEDSWQIAKAKRKAKRAEAKRRKAERQADRAELKAYRKEIAAFDEEERKLNDFIKAKELKSDTAATKSKQLIPTKREVRKLKKQLEKLFTKNCEDGSRCPDGDTIGAAIRLAFHDVAAFDHTLENFGGANGCMEWDAPSHRGLGSWPNPEPDSILGQLDRIHSNGFKDSVSRADLWQFAAFVSLHVALPDGHKLVRFKFRWGRVDAESCSEELGNRLPNAEKPCSHAFDTFARMGFSEREMVTLMGAHTVGKSEHQNTGYHGRWVRNFGILDGSDFYSSIINIPWVQHHRPDEQKTQWLLPDQVEDFSVSKSADRFTMLLNTDVCIAFDIDNEVANPGSDDACMAGGERGTCPRSATFNQVRFFSKGKNNKRWLRLFSKTFKKAMNLGIDTRTLRNPRKNN